jgi:hypothetical protein
VSPTFLFPWFSEKRPVSTAVESRSNRYKPRNLAKSDDSHITIPRLNNFVQTIIR